MLQLNHVSMYHQKDFTELIHDLTVSIQPGDKVAVIGEEGNGKSTLLKWIAGDPTIEDYVKIEGSFQNSFSKTLYLAQRLPEKKENETLESFFFGDQAVTELDYALLYAKASQLGFDSDRLDTKQTLKSLSGGEKVKVQLLYLLAQDPDFLLLDEPSNDLDVQTVQWLENFIKTTPLAVLYISHDATLLENTATKVIQLERIRHKTIARSTVANESYASYVEQRENAFAKQQKRAVKQREEHEKKMERYRRVESSVHDAQAAMHDATAGRLLAKKMHTVKSMGKRFDREAEEMEEYPIQEDAILVKFSNVEPLPNGKVVVQLIEDTLKQGDRILAQSLHLLLRNPEKVGIVGRNGVGKSTLLKALWEDLRNRTDLSVGYMPQSYLEVMDESQTPVSFLTKTHDAEERTKIMTYLGSMRYTKDEMEHPIRDLSGGQQAKLLLLQMDLQGNNVLLLDEPTRNVSPLSQQSLRELFQNFPGTIVTVSHDRLFLDAVCDRIIELTEGGFKEFN